MTPANVLLLAGSSFVIIAIFVLIFASWNAFSQSGRIVATLLPLLALYLLGFGTRQKPGWSDLAKYTILTGSIILPVAVGVLVDQLKLAAYPSSTFFFYVFFVTTIVYVCLEFALRQKTHALLSVVSAIGLACSFSAAINAENYIYCLMGILISVFFLSVAWQADRADDRYQANIYLVAGTVAGLLALVSLPQAYFGFGFNSSVTLGYLVVAVIFFAVAVLYSREWQARKSEHALLLRQIAEIFSALTLIVPAILAALFAGRDTLNALLALIVGVLALLISSFVRVNLFRPLGCYAAAIGLFELVFLAFNQLKAVWPIALLVLGFLLIGIAYGFQHFKYRELFQKFISQSDSSLFGLGLNPAKASIDRINLAAVDAAFSVHAKANTGIAARPPKDPALILVLSIIGVCVVIYVLGSVLN